MEEVSQDLRGLAKSLGRNRPICRFLNEQWVRLHGGTRTETTQARETNIFGGDLEFALGHEI